MRRALLAWSSILLLGFDWSGRIDQLAAGLQSADPTRRREVVEALGTFPTASTRAHLLRSLEDPDTAVRVAAAGLLARGGERSAVPTLVGWLSDPEPALRKAACSALSVMADARAQAPLVRTLGDADGEVRRAAVEALGALSAPDVVVPLLGRLDDSDPRVRQTTAEVLGRLRDERAVVPLVGKVQDLEPEVKIRVIHALASIGDRRATPALLPPLRDPVLEVRIAAMAALGRLRADGAVEPIVTLLDDPDARVRQAALLALGEIGGQGSIDALARALTRSDLRRDAAAALAHVGAPAIPALVARLDDPRSTDVALAAVEALATIGDPTAGPALVEALGAGRVPAPRVLEALGRVADPRTLQPILERLGDRRAEVRLAAADALGPILDRTDPPDGRAADPLLVLAGDGNEALRAKAVRLLGRLGAPRAEPTLLRILEEDAGRMRLEAVRSLGRIRAPGATTKLLPLLDDPDAQLRTEAALAIGRIADAGAIAPLVARVTRTRPSDRVSALHALGLVLRAHPDRAALDLVTTIARGPDEGLAARAIDALARSAAPDGAERLAPVVAAADEHTRAKAVDALASFGGARARALLLAALARDESPLVRAAAAWALGRHPGPESVRALVAALDDSGWGVAPNAIASLGVLGARGAAARICQRAGDRDPLLAAAALRAAASLGGTCARPDALRRALAAPSTLVREIAAHLLAGTADREARDALQTCADLELDSAVARACGDALRRREGSRPPRAEWTEIYLYATDGRTVRPHARTLLVLPDGRIKAALTDLHGFAREEPVPEGTVRVEDPERLSGG